MGRETLEPQELLEPEDLSRSGKVRIDSARRGALADYNPELIGALELRGFRRPVTTHNVLRLTAA